MASEDITFKECSKSERKSTLPDCVENIERFVDSLSEKVYTVADESRHLLLKNVTSLDVADELAALCQRFGPLAQFGAVEGYETERFTRVYHVQYQRIAAAKFAKSQLDERSFFGTHLQACYAPELETLEETADKLRWRRNHYRNGLSRCQGRGKRRTAVAATAVPDEPIAGPSCADVTPEALSGPLIGPVRPSTPEISAEKRRHSGEVAPPAEEAARLKRPRKRIVFKRKELDEAAEVPPPPAPSLVDETFGKLQLVREQVQQAVARSLEKRRRCDAADDGS